jgi:dethiobiotin synthetase
LTPSKIFVTGTDTDVGKTVVSAILVAGLQAVYWKPVQSGFTDSADVTENTDSKWIRTILELSEERICKERFSLSEPLSPHASAKIDGVKIDLIDFELPDTGGCPLIVEGAGGVLVPLNDQHLMLDLMEKFSLPVVVVARSGLGTINHTLLTLRVLKERGLTVLGVVMNGAKNQSNREAIEHFGQCRVLAELEPMLVLSRENIEAEFSRFILQPELT